MVCRAETGADAGRILLLPGVVGRGAAASLRVTLLPIDSPTGTTCALVWC